jgi:hypothetical protein
MSVLGHGIGWLLLNVDAEGGKHIILILTVVPLLTYVLVRFVSYASNSSDKKFWNSHVWAGVQDQPFSRTRAGFDAIRRTQEIVEQGYDKAS